MKTRLTTIALCSLCIIAIACAGCSRKGLLPIEPTTVTTPTPMVLIPAGTFQPMHPGYVTVTTPTPMVLIPSDIFQPMHPSYVDAFYMDKYEVTNAQYKAFVDANPQWQKDQIEDRFHNGNYLFPWDGTNYPPGKANHQVTDVSWYAAMAYAQWAGKRLPTEAEWEYAARGGLNAKKYPQGDTLIPNDANYGGRVRDTTAVGQYAANGYGLYDMAGNAWEWCLDAYGAGIYDIYIAYHNSQNLIVRKHILQSLVENFTSIATSPTHVLRGGSAYFVVREWRVTNRYWVTPLTTSGLGGFRCARRTVTP